MRVQRPTYTKDGERRKSARWHVHFQDSRGTWRRLPAFTDKSASEKLGRRCDILAATVTAGERPDADLSRWIEGLPSKLRHKLGEWGLVDERASAASTPLAGHLADFEQHLGAKGSTSRHVALVISRVRRVLGGCGFVFWADIDAGRIERLLKSMRDDGIGRQTSNFYLASVKHFCRWMIEDRRAAESPIVHLKALNVRADRWRDRRALSGSMICESSWRRRAAVLIDSGSRDRRGHFAIGSRSRLDSGAASLRA